MLLISVARVCFKLGKTTHPTFTFQKVKRDVQMASPVFPMPQFKTTPKALAHRPVIVMKKAKPKLKSKSPAVAARKFRKQRRALSKAPTVGTPSKLVRE